MTTRTRGRLTRERATILKMIRMFCRDHHGQADLCSECAALSTYAFERIARCPFGNDKPVCAQCPVHCYRPAMREKIREVMRYAGPRMLWRHPIAALLHLLDARRRGTRVARG